MVAKDAKRQPNEDLRDLAQEYQDDYRWLYGLGDITEGHYVTVNADRARNISDAYASLPTVDAAVATADAYEALLDELIAQWEWITANGIELLPWTNEGQPYTDSEEMGNDLRGYNRRLYFFTGGEPHPYLNDVTETGYTGNEMLRAVHDVFGHAAEGFGFGPRGEENAWIHHSMMFSPLAQRALTTETRGQNSWVNFGPFSHLPACERPYADQKVALLPEWAWNWKEALRGN